MSSQQGYQRFDVGGETSGQVQGDSSGFVPDSNGYVPPVSSYNTPPSNPGAPYVGQPSQPYQQPGGPTYSQSVGPSYNQGQPQPQVAYVAVPQGQYQQPSGQYGQPYVAYAQPVYGPGQGQGQQGGPRLTGSWSDGICDCFSDCESCCLTCWCPCIRWGLTLKRAGLWTFGAACAVYLLLRVGTNFASPNVYNQISPWIAILGAISAIALIAISVNYRMKLREKHRIPGSPFEDCLCHTFLSCCAVAQEARHVDRDLGLMPMPQGLEYRG
jgi:Cys-rich protein (TIGR01571 family)